MTNNSSRSKFETFNKNKQSISGLKNTSKYPMKDQLISATSNIFFDTKLKTNQLFSKSNITENKRKSLTNYPINFLKNDFSESKTHYEQLMMKNTFELSKNINEIKQSPFDQYTRSFTNINNVNRIDNETVSTEIHNLKTPNQFTQSTFNKEQINLEDLFKVHSNINEVVSLIYNNKIHNDIIDVEKKYVKEYNTISSGKVLHMLKTVPNKVEILKKLCEEKFEILNTIDVFCTIAYFDSSEIKTQINLFFNLEMIYLVCVMCYITENEDNEEVLISIGPIISEIQQIFLFIVLLLVNKVKDDYESNIWLMKLKAAIHNRLNIKAIQTKELFILKQQNSILQNMIKIFIGKNLVSKDLFQLSQQMMILFNNAENFPFYLVRQQIETCKNDILSNFAKMRNNKKYNKDVVVPYLKTLDANELDTYTLVLDLDETLIHYNVIFLLRPIQANCFFVLIYKNF